MPRRLPPLNALPSFEAAARHLNFSRAADELHVTHGAVSRAVRNLEVVYPQRALRRPSVKSFRDWLLAEAR